MSAPQPSAPPSPPAAPSIDNITQYLRSLSASQFYGNVTLRYDRGRIVLVISNQAIKPENLPTVESKPRNVHVNNSPSS